MKRSKAASYPSVTADADGIVSHAGAVLLSELDERAVYDRALYRILQM